MKNFIEELKWRGLFQDTTPGTEAQLAKELTTAYIGFDPTADSLHVGSLIPILLLVHFQRAGHRPIALVGGATGMIGDPSGKSDERNLLDEATLEKNISGIKRVLSRFLDFDSSEDNAALLLNNYTWMKDFSFIDFSREVGKRITVNYMMSKDSVKKRLKGEVGEGMSFTEFTYQLIQGYDFYHLNKQYNCKLQMGGSDQWGNMTTGTELIRRISTQETHAFALTAPLITKADGTKFGKSEGGNIWLDEDKTSVYAFYQFWLNQSDEEAERFIKLYTFLDQETIERLISEHKEAPHQRKLQKTLAEEVTAYVHSKEKLESALKASQILFGKSTAEDLRSLSEDVLMSVFKEVPQATISKENLPADAVTLFTELSGFLPSKSEARRALKQNSLSVNKEKITEETTFSFEDLVSKSFLLLQKGKKNYFLLRVV